MGIDLITFSFSSLFQTNWKHVSLKGRLGRGTCRVKSCSLWLVPCFIDKVIEAEELWFGTVLSVALPVDHCIAFIDDHAGLTSQNLPLSPYLCIYYVPAILASLGALTWRPLGRLLLLSGTSFTFYSVFIATFWNLSLHVCVCVCTHALCFCDVCVHVSLCMCVCASECYHANLKFTNCVLICLREKTLSLFIFIWSNWDLLQVQDMASFIR